MKFMDEGDTPRRDHFSEVTRQLALPMADETPLKKAAP